MRSRCRMDCSAATSPWRRSPTSVAAWATPSWWPMGYTPWRPGRGCWLRRVLHDLHEPLEVFHDRFAQPVETGTRRHPDAPAHERMAGFEVEIEAGAPPFRLAADAVVGVAMAKPARRVRLIRRFVFGKPNVAVDAEHRALGIAGHLGRETREPHIHVFDERPHRLLHLGLVLGAMRLEPRLGVVARQPAQKP